MKENILLQKSVRFSIRVIKLYKYLCEAKKEFVLSKQLLRSGTSIGALISESEFCKQAAYSRQRSKRNKIPAVASETGYITLSEYDSVKTDNEELLKLLTSSTKTAKANLK